ncbi:MULTISPECIES: DUF5302 domain-containing protein [Arthrobacter]|uniref:DUF5302 domain-containing protein n=1 Tax=Arthrobacter alpinus TaxID=656366 RepID=A0A0S2M204_9MICC|nr:MULTISPECIES: DUF5302 domain-containing protein [Arthrobacter]ALO67544.1 hypothetical protein AS189_14915 [Arthrobacter alpinus]MDD0857435.1 DUF5302 domain-containing protein [Arthrobacter alpinus]
MTSNHHDDQTAAGASEETKEKFRQALENKKNQQHGSVSAKGGPKINASHGAAAAKREFRRKSG